MTESMVERRMTTIPDDIMRAARNLYMDIENMKIPRAKDFEGAKMQAFKNADKIDFIARAIMAERERIQQARFEELQAAYRRGVDFACEGAGVCDEDYTELWRYVPKAAYDYADKATSPITSPPSSAASSSPAHPSEQEPDRRPCS